jgi:multisubunit Na+/H+ antiporter MnhF subunit
VWLRGLAEVRRAVAAMAAVLASYGSALLLEHLAGLHVDIVILAIVLSMTLARIQRGADLTDRLVGLAVLPAVSVAASGISHLMSVQSTAGDVLFVLAMAASIWVRRFGPRATRAGMLIVSPLVAVLIMPPSRSPGPGMLWIALVALIVCCWVAVAALIAARTGFSAPAVTRLAAPSLAVAPSAASAAGALAPSTRMAVQLGAALAAAFVAGHAIWPDHWTWVVLTAFIVCSGARGRGDVVLKGVLRCAGAAAGTIVATAIGTAFAPHADATVVVMFAALALATWLREFSYAYWAGCVTAVLSLLYSWFGEAPGPLLDTRLAGIAVGAALGIAASWLILPVRTGDVARRRSADALTALGGVLSADWCNPSALRRQQIVFGHRLSLLNQVAPPLRAQRLLSRRAGIADAIDAIEQCAMPVRTIVAAAPADPETPSVGELNHAIAANILAARRAIGRRPGARYQPATSGGNGELVAALADIDRALGTVCTAFGSVK